MAKSINFPQREPKTVKNRPQPTAQGLYPRDCAHKKPGAVSQPQVAAADAEAKLQPGGKGSKGEKKVGKGCQLRPQRAQKIINDAQRHPHEAGRQESLGRKRRGDHPSSRLSQPVFRGCS